MATATLPQVPEVQAGTQATEADIERIRTQRFQSASWISPKRPAKAADIDNLLGIIKKGNKRLYVIRKPNRQKGDRKLVQKKFKLDPELVDRLKERAEVDRCYEVEVVSAALEAYLR